MTESLSDIEHRLPWGFHDARLFALSVDYTSNRAEFELELMEKVGDADQCGERRVVYRRATLLLNELEALIILPRDPECESDGMSGYLDVDGSDGVPATAKAIVGDVPLTAPYSFFVEQWNSFIIVSAKQPSLTLCDSHEE